MKKSLLKGFSFLLIVTLIFSSISMVFASPAPAAENITVTNSYGTSDKVKVTGLASGDIVKVYLAAEATTVKGTATVGATSTEATVSLNLGTIASGDVWVTVTTKGTGQTPCTPVKKSFDAEAKTPALVADKITVTNNAGIRDTVKVESLTTGQTVKVYATETSTTVLGSASSVSGTANITLTNQLTGSSVWVSVKDTTKNESARVEKAFDAEATTPTLTEGAVTVTNNITGKTDTIVVTGLAKGDVLKAYTTADATTEWAKATSTGTTTYKATISKTFTGVASGDVYVTLTNYGKKESSKLKMSYAAEAQTTAPVADTIKVNNNYGIKDTVVVTSLATGDVVKVYSASTAGTLLGTGTATKGTATVSLTSQLATATGSVFVTVKNKDKNESTRVEQTFIAEKTSITPNNIIVINNVGGDIILVYGLNVGDKVNVYKAADTTLATNLIATGTVAAKQSQVVMNLTAGKLTNAGGSVWITVTSIGQKTSIAAEKTYDAQ